MLISAILLIMSTPFECQRSQSPWNGFTQSFDEEQRGMKISAAPIYAAYERLPKIDALLPGEPLLAIDRKGKRVVANAKLFSDLARIDATGLSKDTRRVLGTVK